MLKCLFFGVLLFVTQAHAQTVTKVTGADAQVSLEAGQVFSQGDSVQFLNTDLNVIGQGEVKKVSSGGSKILVKVLSGNVKAGMTLEKAGSTADKKTQEVSTSKAQGVSYASLSEKEKDILYRGEISEGRYIAGGIIGTWPIGLGVGHAIQGRYTDKGWIFTVGELGAAMVMISGMGDCWTGSRYEACNGSNLAIGAFALVGFKIWEIVDLWAGPPEHNRRFRELKNRLGEGQVTFQPALLPMASGGMLGMRITF